MDAVSSAIVPANQVRLFISNTQIECVEVELTRPLPENAILTVVRDDDGVRRIFNDTPGDDEPYGVIVESTSNLESSVESVEVA